MISKDTPCLGICYIMPLHCIRSLKDPLISLLADDPVRPDIPWEFRVGAHTEVFVLRDNEGREQAVICAAYRSLIPSNVVELALDPEVEPHVALFYTIWSYEPGAGRKLIRATRAHIQEHRPAIKKFVTLSPPTDMARLFHLKNGAEVFRVNLDTVNYLYP
jgi:hypothetical protein